MKARIVPVVLGIALAVPASARTQGPWGYFRIPDLTLDQKARMDALWVSYIRDVMTRRAALQQASVELRVQVSADNPDPAVIREAIERVTALNGQMLDAEIRLVMEVKKVLKPEQLRWFNLDLLSRSRFSEKFVDPDAPIRGGPGPGGFPGGPGPGAGGPPPAGSAVGPQDGGGPGGVCGPGSEEDDDEPPAKGRRKK